MKKVQVFRLGFFVIPFQNRSAEQVFSKSIRVLRRKDRLIPWRWWVAKIYLKRFSNYAGKRSYVDKFLFSKQFLEKAFVRSFVSAICKVISQNSFHIFRIKGFFFNFNFIIAAESKRDGFLHFDNFSKFRATSIVSRMRFNIGLIAI